VLFTSREDVVLHLKRAAGGEVPRMERVSRASLGGRSRIGARGRARRSGRIR
jgi:hypothetical protein